MDPVAHARTEYCPVSIGAALIADRWSILIIRELMLGSHRFNEIHRGLPGISRTLLTSRLRHLERIGVVERLSLQDESTREYHLTLAGRDLTDVVHSIGNWTARWWFPEPTADDVDNTMLLWRMRAALNTAALPPGRTTIAFTFTDSDIRNGWLVIESSIASVCLHDPGFDADLRIHVRGTALHAVWFGHQSLNHARELGDIVIDGPPHLVKTFPKWFTLSTFAPRVAARSTP